MSRENFPCSRPRPSNTYCGTSRANIRVQISRWGRIPLEAGIRAFNPAEAAFKNRRSLTKTTPLTTKLQVGSLPSFWFVCEYSPARARIENKGNDKHLQTVCTCLSGATLTQPRRLKARGKKLGTWKRLCVCLIFPKLGIRPSLMVYQTGGPVV